MLKSKLDAPTDKKDVFYQITSTRKITSISTTNTPTTTSTITMMARVNFIDKIVGTWKEVKKVNTKQYLKIEGGPLWYQWGANNIVMDLKVSKLSDGYQIHYYTNYIYRLASENLYENRPIGKMRAREGV